MLTKDNVSSDEDAFTHARMFNFYTFKENSVYICLSTKYFTEFEACVLTILHNSQMYDIILDYEKDMEVIEE